MTTEMPDNPLLAPGWEKALEEMERSWGPWPFFALPVRNAVLTLVDALRALHATVEAQAGQIEVLVEGLTAMRSAWWQAKRCDFQNQDAMTLALLDVDKLVGLEASLPAAAEARDKTIARKTAGRCAEIADYVAFHRGGSAERAALDVLNEINREFELDPKAAARLREEAGR